MSSGATIRTRSASSSGQRLLLGRRLDVRAARDLDRVRLLGGHWLEDVALDDLGARGRALRELRRRELARVRDHAGQHRGGGDRRRAEVDLVVRGAAAAREVAVEGPQRVRAGRRRLAHADARPAGRLEHAHARHQQLDVGARARDLVEDLARAGRRGRGDELLGDLSAAEHGAAEREILVRRVDGRADADLRELGADELVDCHDVSRRRRLRHQRDELGEVDVLLLVEVAGTAGLERDEVLLPLLLDEPRARLVVGREDRAGRAELGDHVGDRPALAVAERRRRRAR